MPVIVLFLFFAVPWVGLYIICESLSRPALEMLTSVITGVEFLTPSGNSVGGMTLSSIRSCTFIS